MRPDPDNYVGHAGRPARPTVRGEALLSAAIFLFCAYSFWSLKGISGNPLYDLTTGLFAPMCLAVGVGMLIVAALAATGQRWVLLVELLAGALAALGCLLIGGVWLAFGDMSGGLLLLFGALNAASVRSAYYAWRAGSASAYDREDAPAAAHRPAPADAAAEPPAVARPSAAPAAPLPALPPRDPVLRVPLEEKPRLRPAAAPALACPDCGLQSDGSSLFCQKCGKVLRSGPAGGPA